MNESKTYNSERRIDDEQAGSRFNSWSEDDFEELQQETPWEIFASEINNWASLNLSSNGFMEI